MKLSDDTISEAASIMGKRGWKARVEKYGLKKLQQHMREVGKQATGRPRLPDDTVQPASLYQRERRARLRRKKSREERSENHESL